MTAPSFSFVIPAYNAAPTLPAALASVRAQTDADYEVIVVDDGSADGSGDVAERLGATVVRQVNAGLPAARNAGVRAARGRWLAFLDSDDLLMPGYLARMRSLMESRPDAGLAYCDAWIFDEARGRVYRRSAMGPYRPADPPQEAAPFFRALVRSNFVYVAAVTPRELIESLGGFEESLRAAEDWQMWLRVAAAGHPAVGTGERLGVYRRSAGQMSGDPRRMYEGRLAALRSLRPGLPAELEPALAESEAAAVRAAERVATAQPGGRRDTARKLLAPALALRNFHLRMPAEVAAAFPDLARTRGRV